MFSSRSLWCLQRSLRCNSLYTFTPQINYSTKNFTWGTLDTKKQANIEQSVTKFVKLKEKGIQNSLKDVLLSKKLDTNDTFVWYYSLQQSITEKDMNKSILVIKEMIEEQILPPNLILGNLIELYCENEKYEEAILLLELLEKVNVRFNNELFLNFLSKLTNNQVDLLPKIVEIMQRHHIVFDNKFTQAIGNITGRLMTIKEYISSLENNEELSYNEEVSEITLLEIYDHYSKELKTSMLLQLIKKFKELRYTIKNKRATRTLVLFSKFNRFDDVEEIYFTFLENFPEIFNEFGPFHYTAFNSFIISKKASAIEKMLNYMEKAYIAASPKFYFKLITRHSSSVEMAIKYYQQMRATGVEVKKLYILNSLMDVANRFKDNDNVFKFHAFMLNNGFYEDSLTFCYLICTYIRLNDKAKMISSWDRLITGSNRIERSIFHIIFNEFIDLRKYDKIFYFFHWMDTNNKLAPNGETFALLWFACFKLNDFDRLKKIEDLLDERRIYKSTFYTSLIYLCYKHNERSQIDKLCSIMKSKKIDFEVYAFYNIVYDLLIPNNENQEISKMVDLFNNNNAVTKEVRELMG